MERSGFPADLHCHFAFLVDFPEMADARRQKREFRVGGRADRINQVGAKIVDAIGKPATDMRNFLSRKPKGSASNEMAMFK
jgi:hypothetical protein